MERPFLFRLEKRPVIALTLLMTLIMIYLPKYPLAISQKRTASAMESALRGRLLNTTDIKKFFMVTILYPRGDYFN